MKRGGKGESSFQLCLHPNPMKNSPSPELGRVPIGTLQFPRVDDREKRGMISPLNF